MPDRIKSGKISVVSTMENTRGHPDEETPFRIAILGDFSGRQNRGKRQELISRSFQRVDRDNLDETLKKCAPQLSLSILGKDAPLLTVKFSELDDFLPDRLYEKLEIFQALRDMREALTDPAACAALAKKILPVENGHRSSSEADIRKTVESVSVQTPGNLLDQVLGVSESKESGPRMSGASSEWDTFLKEIVRPHVEPKSHPRQREMVEATDAAIGEMMRRILHHPDFQNLEAAWRGLHFLVSRIETDEQLTLSLFDVSKEELIADLLASDDLRATVLYTILVEHTVKTPGGEPWTVVIGNYTFNQSPEDAHLLARIAKIAHMAGAPFIAEASPHLLGCESLAETPDPDTWNRPIDKEAGKAWEALRKLPDISYVGLALPRFLLRLPYGANTEPIESFEFEEMPETSRHDSYLWGNPALACAYVLGETFSRYGWDFQGRTIQDIEDLPLHVYKEHGQSHAKPCAEAILTEGAAEIILQRGLMPLVSFKNQNRVRLVCLQSLADPPASLAGRWFSPHGEAG